MRAPQNASDATIHITGENSLNVGPHILLRQQVEDEAPERDRVSDRANVRGKGVLLFLQNVILGQLNGEAPMLEHDKRALKRSFPARVEAGKVVVVLEYHLVDHVDSLDELEPGQLLRKHHAVGLHGRREEDESVGYDVLLHLFAADRGPIKV